MKRALAVLALVAGCSRPEPVPPPERPLPPPAPACLLTDAPPAWVVAPVPEAPLAPVEPVPRVRRARHVDHRPHLALPAGALADASPPLFVQAPGYEPTPDRDLLSVPRRVVQQAHQLTRTDTPAGALQLNLQSGGARLTLTRHF